MTEEEIKALQIAKDEAERKVRELEAQVTGVAAERDKFKEDVTKVVDELKEERRKKNEALGKVNLQEGLDINSLIEDALQKREQETLQTEYERAIAEFKNSKPEFQADAAGLVFGKFEEGLKRFNFSDIKSKEQIKNRLEEAYQFLKFKPMDEQGNEYDGTPSSTYTPPVQQEELPSEMKAAIDMTGVDVSRAKSLREKYPEAFESLGM